MFIPSVLFQQGRVAYNTYMQVDDSVKLVIPNSNPHDQLIVEELGSGYDTIPIHGELAP